MYSLAVSATLLVGLLPAAVGQALSRTFGEEADPSRALRRGVHAALVGGVGTAVVLAVVSPTAVPIVFGIEFAPASRLIAIMVPFTAIFAVSQVTIPYFYNHLRRPGAHSIIMGVTAALDVVLVVLLAPKWGADGAAVASGAAYGTGAVVNIWLTSRGSHLRVRELVVPSWEDIMWLGRTTRDYLRMRAA